MYEEGEVGRSDFQNTLGHCQLASNYHINFLNITFFFHFQILQTQGEQIMTDKSNRLGTIMMVTLN